MKQHLRPTFYNSPKRPPTTAKIPIKIGISDELPIIAAAPFEVLLGAELVPVELPLPVPVAWTFLLLETHVNAPLMTLPSLSFWNGLQSMSPELCMLNVPLQSLRAGSAASEVTGEVDSTSSLQQGEIGELVELGVVGNQESSSNAGQQWHGDVLQVGVGNCRKIATNRGQVGSRDGCHQITIESKGAVDACKSGNGDG